MLYPAELKARAMERVMGIEPTRPAWKAGILPLNYTRIGGLSIVPKCGYPYIISYEKEFVKWKNAKKKKSFGEGLV